MHKLCINYAKMHRNKKVKIPNTSVILGKVKIFTIFPYPE